TVEWDLSYLGYAYISVKAINECGEGEFSEELEVTVDNTVNIPDDEKHPDVRIFPNPNTGQFTLVFDTDKLINVDIKIFNMMGNLVYQKNNLHANKKLVRIIDASSLSSGVYHLIIQSNDFNLNKKIIIQ
ncbi:MAG: T9SS type A sorting domain-containing protein, partial [Bacteroidales bacterium]|nr:T9SS type A sorting domain-containing protein [Bacteroidales bacterium]